MVSQLIFYRFDWECHLKEMPFDGNALISNSLICTPKWLIPANLLGGLFKIAPKNRYLDMLEGGKCWRE
jgi:hypothetical protein